MRTIFSLFTSTESFFMRIVSSFTSDLDIAILIAKFCSYSFWAYMSLSILGTIGIDTKPFLTVLNIAFITLGFAAKDIITSFFAGIFILLIRPFQRGSVVCIQGYRGQVVSVDMRYVKLLDQTNGNMVLIPLSMVYGSPIVLETVDQHGLSWKCPVNKLKRMMVVLPMFDFLRSSRFSIYVNSSPLTHNSVHHRLMKGGLTDIFTPLTLTRLPKAVVDCYPCGLWHSPTPPI